MALGSRAGLVGRHVIPVHLYVRFEQSLYCASSIGGVCLNFESIVDISKDSWLIPNVETITIFDPSSDQDRRSERYPTATFSFIID